MDDITRALLQDVLVPVISSLLVALGGWVLTKLPGPLRDALTANVHAKDVNLVVNAMARRAVVIATGQVATALPAQDVISYTRAALPNVTAKLGLSDLALETMAKAALAHAQSDSALVQRVTEATRAAAP